MFSITHLLFTIFIVFVAAEDASNITSKQTTIKLSVEQPGLAFKPKTRRRAQHHHPTPTNNASETFLPDVDLGNIIEVSMNSVIPDAIHSTKTENTTTTTTTTVLEPLELIMTQLLLPKRRASDMLCDVTSAKKKILRCTEINLKSIFFEESECLDGVCSRIL
jgi:hypothetical protein